MHYYKAGAKRPKISDINWKVYIYIFFVWVVLYDMLTPNALKISLNMASQLATVLGVFMLVKTHGM